MNALRVMIKEDIDLVLIQDTIHNLRIVGLRISSYMKPDRENSVSLNCRTDQSVTHAQHEFSFMKQNYASRKHTFSSTNRDLSETGRITIST